MKGLDPDLRSLQEMRDLVGRAKAAAEAVSGYGQAEIDRLCKAMAAAGAAAAFDLARLAVEETGIGRVHHKVLKNLLGSEGVWESIKDERTVGIVRRDEARGVLEVATPVGVVAGIVPTTNPTSTALFKCLIAVKGRNAIVISPHPRSRRCIAETVEVLRSAIERAGGPPDLCCCIPNPTIETTGALMKHRDVAIILSTGGSGLVRAAYSSGKPAYGVGPGNVPAYVDRSADVERMAADLVSSQSFDNGTLCCSEQALVLDRPIEERALAALRARGAHLCDAAETAKLAAFCNRDGHMNPDVVGLDPWRIAELAGFQVPRATSLLLARQGGVGRDFPLSIEILCPLLSVHVVDGWREGCAVSKALLHYGGLGHTMGVHARDEAVLEAFFLEKPASRIVANGPTSQGAVGFSTNLVPSMSLGCGPQAGNITSDNITARHLVNLKRVAFPRRDWQEIERRYHERAAALTGEAAPRGSGLPGDPALEIGRSVASASSGAPPAGSNWMGNPAFRPESFGGAARPGVAPRPPTSMGAATSMGATSKVAPAPKTRPSGGAPRFTESGELHAGAGRNPAASGLTAGGSSGATQRAQSVAWGYAAPAGSPPGAAATFAPGAAATFTPGASSAFAPGAPATSQGRRAVEVGAGMNAGDIEEIMKHAGAGCPLGPCRGCAHHDVRTGACTA